MKILVYRIMKSAFLRPSIVWPLVTNLISCLIFHPQYSNHVQCISILCPHPALIGCCTFSPIVLTLWNFLIPRCPQSQSAKKIPPQFQNSPPLCSLSLASQIHLTILSLITLCTLHLLKSIVLFIDMSGPPFDS